MEPPLRTTLALLEKMTLAPEALAPSDVDAVRAAGLSDEAISDAVHVSFMFNLIDRLADSFGWPLRTPEGYAASAGFMLKKGYEMAGPVRRRALARG